MEPASDHQAAAVAGPLPDRYQPARHHVVDGLMPDEFVSSMGSWLHHNRGSLECISEYDGEERYSYELPELESHCELTAPFRARLFDEVEAALQACEVARFEVGRVEMQASLYHHGSHFNWHTDLPGDQHDPDFVAYARSRRLSFCYYLHSTPKMFTGGDLEFLDGTSIEPKTNRLVFFDPAQVHRVTRVESWSAGHALHGRWALSGWLHGGDGGLAS